MALKKASIVLALALLALVYLFDSDENVAYNNSVFQ